jgi:hypothetical protein
MKHACLKDHTVGVSRLPVLGTSWWAKGYLKQQKRKQEDAQAQGRATQGYHNGKKGQKIAGRLQQMMVRQEKKEGERKEGGNDA